MTLAEALRELGITAPQRAVRVAVVDSGVYAAHPHVQGITRGVSLVEGADPEDYVDRNGHGTAVTAAIREKAPAAEIIAVKIFDRTLAVSARDLARAIQRAADEDADLINLSLGTTNPAHAELLQAAVTEARTHGAVVVSAADQAGVPSLPGSLRGVVAVSVDWDIDRDEAVVEAASADAVRLRTSGYPRPIPGVSRDRNLKGISFAVANATGIIARTLG